ncbi:MAG: hypothetical protein J3K34DRAFT_419078 [Monoraphidium minutum]|nr:MAG: hypothetical protein J3K34DRAFT_419078 [Monoraphidium minutum]
MCFSPPISMGIGTASWAMALWLWLGRKEPALGRRALMFWYFGFIEFLQVAQYQVADQCDNPANQWMTYIAYMHIAFQPLVVNNYFWAGHAARSPELTKFILRMCTLGGVMMLLRLPGMPLGWLGDRVHHLIPDFPPSSMAGKGCHYLESSCHPTLCSLKGGGMGHISWGVPLLPSTYFIPGASLHFFLFFVPTLLAGAGVRRKLMVGTLIIGPLMSMYMTKGDLKTYPLEWPTIWCFFAALQSAAAMLFEIGWPTAFAPRPRRPKPADASGAANGVKAE